MQYDFNMRQKCIIHYLSSKNDYCSGEELASVAHVTSRTIRKEIKDINFLLNKQELSDYFVIDSVHSKGYRFAIHDRAAFREFIHDLDYDTNALEQRLWNFIEKQIRLLTVMVDQLDIERLEEIIHYSEPAIRAVVRDMDRQRDPRDKLTITMEGNRFYAQGSEYFIRMGALNVIFADPSYKGATSDAMAYLKDEGFEEYTRACMINEFIHDPQYSTGALGIESLVQFLWISHVRNTMGHFLSFSEEDVLLIERYDECLALARRIMKAVQRQEQYLFTDPDTYALALLITCACDFRNVQEIPLDSESDFLCRHTTRVFMEEMRLDPKYEGQVLEAFRPFFYAFYLRSHFKLARQYMGITRIKRKAVSAVEYARHLSQEVERKSGIRFSDKETVYFSRSIARLQSLINEKSGQRILVSSKYGLAEGKHFASSLQRTYGSYISELKVVETYEIDTYAQDFDLIFTDDNKREPTGPNGSKFRLYSEYSGTRSLPSGVVYDIRQRKDTSYFLKMIQSGTFLSLHANSREDVFAHVERLVRQICGIEGPVREEIAREDDRLTHEYGYRTALIHVRNAEIQQDQVRIGTLQKPIVWRNRLVQLVIIVFTGEDPHALWQYEQGLKGLMRTASNTSLLINKPEVGTLQKIFEEGQG